MQLFGRTYLAYHAIYALTLHYALSIFFQVERQNKRRIRIFLEKMLETSTDSFIL